MKIAVCLIIKDENEYLEEWLDWHRARGVTRFYIYDNGSAVPVRETVGTADDVTVVDFSAGYKHAQLDAYADCLSRFRDEADWIAFIDTDEFINILDGAALPDWLQQYAEFDCVTLPWVVYGAGGQLRRTDGSVRSRFTVTADYPPSMPHEKSIIRTAGAVIRTGAHIPMEYRWMPVKIAPVADAVIDHYFTRSYEEWQKKMARGSCDPFYARKDDWFLRINPEMRDAVEQYERKKAAR